MSLPLLRPCPFCGVEVKRFDQPDLPGILHPENDCLLGGELWTFDKVERWNARAEIGRRPVTRPSENAISLVVEAIGKCMVGSSLEDQAVAALEASHHAELVEALKMVVRGADSRNRCAPYVNNAIRVLAKIGGDA